MKAGIVTLLVLALGTLAAIFLLQDNGYVLINFRGYVVEMSVPALAFLLVLAYFALRLLVRIWRAPRQLGELAAGRRHRKAGERIVRGYIEMGQGNYARGEKLLTRGVRDSETPLVNYLAAARAAQAQGDYKRRDNWLQMAYDDEPRAAATILLTQAELQLASGETETARTSLNRLLELTPGNPEGLRMQARLYRKEADWDGLYALLPRLAKTGRIDAAELDALYVATWQGLLAKPGQTADGVRRLWKELPKHLRAEPTLLNARIQALVADGRAEDAEVLIRKALNSKWSDDLILRYGQLDQAEAAPMLLRAESWLKQRPDDPALLLTAARLCMRNQLWGKARSYFESSIALKPSAAAWHDLGQLLVQMGEDEDASAAFQKGLTLSYGGSALPRLAADAAEKS